MNIVGIFIGFVLGALCMFLLLCLMALGKDDR